MARKFILPVILTTSFSAIAQQPMSPNRGAAPVAQPAGNVAPGTNIYVVGGGLYGTGVYIVPGGVVPGGPASVPAGPEVTQIGNVGISTAATAGISLNTPVDLGVQSTLVPENPVVVNNAGYSIGGGAGNAGAAAATGAASGRLINDMGPSYYEGTVETAAAGPSLGEVAAQYKGAPQRPVRMYTNADAERAASTVGVGNISTAASAVPAGAMGTTGTPPSADNRQMAANTPPPPVAAEPQTTPSQETPSRLPQTASPLPLLGLLGLIGGGIGLWLRRSR